MNPSSFISHVRQGRRQEPTQPEPRVGTLVRSTAVRVPAWFTAAQALRVAELKGARHLLVEGRDAGVATRGDLERAPASDLVLRWAHRRVPSIDAEASASDARRVLKATGAPCLCVERGRVLLGTVSPDDLTPVHAGGDHRKAA
jgi:CBS domain-containing protein